jgi:ribosomal protein S18 acetylase RimI-like enzyme
MALDIQPALQNDFETILAMMRELYGGEGFRFPVRAGEALQLLLREPNYGRCFILQEGGQPVGYLVVAFGFSLEFGGRDAFLDEFYLVPGARGRGLGKLAVRHAAEFCRSEGMGAVHLEVSRSNAPAQRLYRAAGFRERHAGYDLLTLRIEPNLGGSSGQRDTGKGS